MTLGEKVRSLREARGLSQLELGRGLGHNYGQYAGKIERGETKNPTASTLRAIARTLDCTVSYLLGEEVTSETNEAA